MTFRLWALLAAVGVAAGFVLGTYAYGYQQGAASERQTILTRSVEVLRERSRADEEVRDMDAARLCAALGGLPDECAGIGM